LGNRKSKTLGRIITDQHNAETAITRLREGPNGGKDAWHITEIGDGCGGLTHRRRNYMAVPNSASARWGGGWHGGGWHGGGWRGGGWGGGGWGWGGVGLGIGTGLLLAAALSAPYYGGYGYSDPYYHGYAPAYGYGPYGYGYRRAYYGYGGYYPRYRYAGYPYRRHYYRYGGYYPNRGYAYR
jgi:hypothetical protein